MVDLCRVGVQLCTLVVPLSVKGTDMKCQTVTDAEQCIVCGIRPHSDDSLVGAHKPNPLRCFHGEAAHTENKKAPGTCMVCGCGEFT